jgi:nucleoside-diphosphate-sugar epimerase
MTKGFDKYPMKVLILGCGYTGKRLAQHLIRQSAAVHGTNRTGNAITNLSVPVFAFDYRAGDAKLPPDLAFQDVTHVLSTIAPDAQGIDPVAASLMPTLRGLNLSWFGYLSTTGVYGDAHGAWVTEESPVNSQNLRSQHRINIEATFLKSGLPAHIFRLPGIYGPGRNIFERLRNGTANHIHKPGHVFSRIHADDIVQALELSMRSPRPGSIYNIADDEPSEPSTLILEGSKLLGIAAPPAQSLDLATLSPMAASFWQECRRVGNRKMKQELGVQLIYPTYREGLAACLAEE